MKKFIITAIVAAGLMVQSCTKVDENVYDKYTADQFFADPKGADIALASVYARMPQFGGGDNGYYDTNNMSTDEQVVPHRVSGDWGPENAWLYTRAWTPALGQINNTWNACYNSIYLANLAVEQLEKANAPAAKIAEVKILRAWFYYLLIDFNGDVYVRKRGPGDIWENLYEFVLYESNEALAPGNFPLLKEILGEKIFEVEHISAIYKQLLTHQTIRGQFIRVKIKERILLNGFKLVEEKALQKLPFPKYISNYLKDKNVSLNLF